MSHNFFPHPHITVSSHTHSPRYYQPSLSIWLSVDPMADKYPSLSPYTYCGNNPVRLVDPNGEYGVLALNQGKSQNIVWRGKVRVSLPEFRTATLHMTYYYSTGSTQGSMESEQIEYIRGNIAKNLNPLVGQSISIGGSEYQFNYDIQFVAANNATQYDLYNMAEKTTYGGHVMGNYIQAGSIAGDDVGWGSQYSMVIDFPKMNARIADGRCDGQTPTHELMHNIGAIDTRVYGGTNIMDWNQRTVEQNQYGITNIFSTPKRTVNIQDVENVINHPHYSNRISIITE